jgi:hypothetical protein
MAEWIDVDTGLPRSEMTRKHSEIRHETGKGNGNEGEGSSSNDYAVASGTPPTNMCGFESMGDFDAMMDWTGHGEVM